MKGLICIVSVTYLLRRILCNFLWSSECAVVQFVLHLGGVLIIYPLGSGRGSAKSRGVGAEKFEVLPYWGGHLSFKIATVYVLTLYFAKLEHLKAGIKGEEHFYTDTLSYGWAYELKEHWLECLKRLSFIDFIFSFLSCTSLFLFSFFLKPCSLTTLYLFVCVVNICLKWLSLSLWELKASYF